MFLNLPPGKISAQADPKDPKWADHVWETARNRHPNPCAPFEHPCKISFVQLCIPPIYGDDVPFPILTTAKQRSSRWVAPNPHEPAPYLTRKRSINGWILRIRDEPAKASPQKLLPLCCHSCRVDSKDNHSNLARGSGKPRCLEDRGLAE